MATTTLNQTIATTYTATKSHTSVFTKFMNWCEGQQENRMLWIGLALAGHGCILTPLTVMIVLFAGTNMFLFMLAIVAMGMALVTNLAALPTKVTIPIFFFSILLDVVIVIAALSMGIDIAKTYI